MTIGERISTLRKSKGLSQSELGTMCGTTKQTIYKYETGIITNIPLDRLERISSALDTTTAHLMGWCDGGSLKIGDSVRTSTARNLKRARENAKMTQEEAAKALGVAPQDIRNYEQGVGDFSRDALAKFCAVYDVRPESILPMDEEELEMISDMRQRDSQIEAARRQLAQQKETPPVEEDEELNEYLEMLKTRKECRMLFQLAKNATKEDVEQAVKIIEALRK